MAAIRAGLALILFGGAALICANAWLGLGGPAVDELASTEIYDAVVIAAAIACLLRARAIERERWAWTVIGIAVLFWAGGEVYWSQVLLEDSSPPYPSPADALYIAFYPLAYAGLALLVHARAHQLN